MSQATAQDASPKAQRSAAELRRIWNGLSQPRAAAARYDRQADAVVIEFKNGVVLMVPTRLIEGVSGADPDLIARLEMDHRGLVLNWEELGAGLMIPNLMAGCFGSRRWMDELRGRSEAMAPPVTA
jgi:hypothetical protein